MTNASETALKSTARAEKKLLTELALKDPTFKSIDELLFNYRSSCEDYIFLDFETAALKRVHDQLWDAHVKINKRYRTQLAKFRDGESKKKPVERRKLEKHYLDFIKSSTRFYRGFIQRLASHFTDIPEVLQIAHKFSLSTLSAEPQVPADIALHQLIIQSCHSTLIRLGDLSRYRETELQTKERNWGPAKGYYDLAAAIDPASGASFNQLAVIALADGDHLRAVYFLHRALTVAKPFPTAQANLDLEFKKILDLQKRQKLITPENAGKPGSGLSAWFVAFHANCHTGVEFKGQGELESEILGQLAVELKERPLESTLSKFSLVNIAAEFLASRRAADTQRSKDLQACLSLQSFNVKTFFTLLEILLQELEQVWNEEDVALVGANLQLISGKLNATARRLLPSLRNYSSWLMCNYLALLGQTSEAATVQIKEFWRRYAETLTLLTASFPITELPTASYLLEEDLDTFAFQPLLTEDTKSRYQKTDDKFKLKIGDPGVQRLQPHEEMLVRIRDLVLDGLKLVVRKDTVSESKVPINLAEGQRFVYQDNDLIEATLPSQRSTSHSHNHSSASVNREDIEKARKEGRSGRLEEYREDVSETATASASVSTAMHQMVDGLVESETSESNLQPQYFPQISHGDTPPTPTLDDFDIRSAETSSRALQNKTLTAVDLVRHMKQSSPAGGFSTAVMMEREQTLRPALPSVWNTPFAPLPGEAGSSQPRPSTAHRVENNISSGYQPSSGMTFQQELARQHQQLHLQSSPVLAHPPSSAWSQYDHSSQGPARYMIDGPSPWLIPPSYSHSLSPGPAGSRASPLQSIYGAIGQTPPSGQAG